jgi:ankyrin repeat protein
VEVWVGRKAQEQRGFNDDSTESELTEGLKEDDGLEEDEDLKAEVDACDAGGLTPLMIAAMSGQTKCCELLLLGGAKAGRTAQNGLTPLFLAVS